MTFKDRCSFWFVDQFSANSAVALELFLMVFIMMCFLDCGHYSAVANGQPDARAAMEIKFCSKAPLFPLRGKNVAVN